QDAEDQWAEEIEAVQAGAAVEVADLRRKARRPRRRQGADRRHHRLVHGRNDLLAGPRLASLEVHLRREHVLRHRARGEIGGKHDVAGQAAFAQAPVGGGSIHRAGAHRRRGLQAGCDVPADPSLIEVDDSHGGMRPAASKQEVQQAQDDDGRHEKQREGPPVVTELGEDAHRDRADAAGTHGLPSPEPAADAADNFRKASSSRSTRAIRRSSWGLPSARSLPKRIRPSRWQRSASSITWLETTIVIPSAAIAWKRSQSWTRSCGSTPTVGSSSSNRSG